MLIAFLASSAFADEPVDLELVLAIDASSSVDDNEWALQRAGYAAAFRDPQNPGGARLGPEEARRDLRRRVGGRHGAALGEPWFVLSTPADGERMAGFMAALPRIPAGGTGIGAGVAAAIRKFERNGLSAPREVVDVSGDGRETPPRENVVLIPMAHALAEAKGVTVNGLAIVNEDPEPRELVPRQRHRRPGELRHDGTGLHEFAEAIRKKLLKEIEHQERLSLR